MSIASEIERLNGAKSAISAAIAEKGVTVPDGTKIDGMALLVAAIKAKLQEKSATPSTSEQEIFPDSGYDGLSKVTVDAIPSATQATPTISVSSSGLITARSTQSEGYVEAGTKSATKQLTTQAAQTITPGTSNKTISSGRYLTGTQTIKGDPNLVTANIKSGVSIFGVAGSCASTEFCNLIFRNYYGRSVYLSVSGESHVGNQRYVSRNEEVTISNVPRYGYVVVNLTSYVSADVSLTGANKLYVTDDKIYVFYVTAENGATATIEIS